MASKYTSTYWEKIQKQKEAVKRVKASVLSVCEGVDCDNHSGMCKLTEINHSLWCPKCAHNHPINVAKRRTASEKKSMEKYGDSFGAWS